MSDASSRPLQQLRAEWRERLRSACDRAVAQVDDMGLADLRALRATIDEELEDLSDRLPDPGPVEAKGPMTTDEQAAHVQTALRYNALQVRRHVVHHELRRRALGPVAVEAEVEVPAQTKRFATLAWEVMGEADVETTEDVYREVARRVEDDVHLTTVEKWLRTKNPHHPAETEGASPGTTSSIRSGRWTDLRRAVLLASA